LVNVASHLLSERNGHIKSYDILTMHKISDAGIILTITKIHDSPILYGVAN